MHEEQVFRQLLDWGKGSICQECIYTEACKNAHEACVECSRFSGKDGSRNETRCEQCLSSRKKRESFPV